jgi:hypothetical protein
VPYGYPWRSGVPVIHEHRDDQEDRRTPRGWAVAPRTPAEAPQAKRRTAARSRGSVVLVAVVAVAFVVFVLLLVMRIGKRVGAVEPAIGPLEVSVPVASASPPRGVEPPPLAVLGTHPHAADAGPALPVASAQVAGVRGKPGREVFRKPGF